MRLTQSNAAPNLTNTLPSSTRFVGPLTLVIDAWTDPASKSTAALESNARRTRNLPITLTPTLGRRVSQFGGRSFLSFGCFANPQQGRAIRYQWRYVLSSVLALVGYLRVLATQSRTASAARSCTISSGSTSNFRTAAEGGRFNRFSATSARARTAGSACTRPSSTTRAASGGSKSASRLAASILDTGLPSRAALWSR